MRIFARLLAFFAALLLTAQSAAAQSVLRDAETEALFRDMVAPITDAAGLSPNAVEVVLVNDTSINAFVAGGQRIYINAGLINAADDANEVQGVMAHEMGHITGGHVIRMNEGFGRATNISILSLLVGVAAAVAGAPDAAMASVMAGQSMAYNSLLAFTRVQEASADAAGATYLSKAGISGKGSIEFFKKLQNLEFRYGYDQSDDAGYARTHPLTGDRISRLQQEYVKDPAWNKQPDPKLQERFVRVKAKLYGYLAKPADTLRSYPEYLTDIPSRYARAYAYHKEARVDAALEEANALIEADPDDPYFLELKGQVLLESGRADQAIEPLRKATAMTGSEPLIASTLGHALVATENPANLDEAEQVLRAAVGRDRENPFAWYQLGMVYGAKGDIPRARLASAEQLIMNDRPAEALQNAKAAEMALPEQTPDWLRAQDIAMQARAQLEREDKRN